MTLPARRECHEADLAAFAASSYSAAPGDGVQ